MVPGFNHNIKHKGLIFHIQTEDSGTQNPHIITHLFVGGNILATKKTSYADIVQAENLPEIVRELMQEQHKAMLRNLINGVYDELATGPSEPPPVSAPPKGVPPPLSRPVPLPPSGTAPPPPVATASLPPLKSIPPPPPGTAPLPPAGVAPLPPPKPLPLPLPKAPAAAPAPLEPGKFPRPVSVPEPPVSAPPPAAAKPAARVDTTAAVSARRPPSTTKIMIPSEMEAERVVTSEAIPTNQPRVVLRQKVPASLPPAPASAPPPAKTAPPPSPKAVPPPPASTLPPPGTAPLPPSGIASLPPEVVAARALAEKPKPKDVSGPTIFGENLISEKSLDEVILGYLAGNEDEGK